MNLSHRISAKAEAARERARDHGKFGVQHLDRSTTTVPRGKDGEPASETLTAPAGITLGRFSIAPETTIRDVWPMEDGTYLVHQETHGVSSRVRRRPNTPDVWEGIEVNDGEKLTKQERDEYRNRKDDMIRHQASAQVLGRLMMDDVVRERQRLIDAPEIEDFPIVKVTNVVCTDPEDMHGSALARETRDYEDGPNAFWGWGAPRVSDEYRPVYYHSDMSDSTPRPDKESVQQPSQIDKDAVYRRLMERQN